VVATQNPNYQIGTFPLPESQLDRFLMRLELGFPDAAAERQLLKSEDRRELLKDMDAGTDPATLITLQAALATITVSDALVDYVQALLKFSRQSPQFSAGLSPRAGLALLHCAQAWAMLAGRDHALPEDVQAILHPVVGHRLRSATDHHPQNPETLTALLQGVAIP